MDIVCRKYSCKFNKNTKCERKHLHVNNKSNCNDIEIDKTKETEDVSKDMNQKLLHSVTANVLI